MLFLTLGLDLTSLGEKSKYKFNKNIRLTLDYKEDYILLRKIFLHFPKWL